MIATHGDRRARDVQWFAITAALLMGAVLALYAPVVNHDFIDFDDPNYVGSHNPMVSRGLTFESIQWAFTTGHASNWHPLTWLSHMVDFELFGDWPGGHLLHNVVLHGLTSVLLYYLLWRMTASLWPSAFVAAVFALHPLRVESVAWASERKDALGALFWMLTMWAYLAYVRRGGIMRYGLVCITFTLGLMAKPMLVTLPAVLLLLDVWPIRRLRSRSDEVAFVRGVAGLLLVGFLLSRDAQRSASKRQPSDGSFRQPSRDVVANRPLFMLLEKLSLFALTIIASIITLRVQSAGGATTGVEAMGLADRASHVTVSYVANLWHMFWPIDLGLLYPLPRLIGDTGWSAWQVAGCAVLLVAITGAALFAARQPGQRYLIVGWLWYLGVLLPVSGIVQVGQQAWADRYSYLPSIGIAIMVAWMMRDLAARLAPVPRRVTILVLAAGVLVACVVLTARQIPHWRSAVSIYEHTIAVTDRNWITLNNLGIVYHDQAVRDHDRSRLEDATRVFTEATRIIESFPEGARRFPEPYVSLGHVANTKRQYNDAIAWYQRAIAIDPNYAKAYNNLSSPLMQLGRVDDAAEALERAIALSPDYELAHFNLGIARSAQRRSEDAIAQWCWVLARNPKRPHLVRILLEEIESLASGNPAAARQAIDDVLRIAPQLHEAQQLRQRLTPAGTPSF